jgi:hypothetical protein
MVIRRLIAVATGAVALALATATVTPAGAAEPVPGAAEPVSCALGGKNFAHSVKPLYVYEDAGYTVFRQFRGAEVFVPAQPGLTAEWLDRVLTSQVAAGQCNFGVSKVDVQVLSDGGGFSVRLSSHNEKGAADILRYAQQIVK